MKENFSSNPSIEKREVQKLSSGVRFEQKGSPIGGVLIRSDEYRLPVKTEICDRSLLLIARERDEEMRKNNFHDAFLVGSPLAVKDYGVMGEFGSVPVSDSGESLRLMSKLVRLSISEDWESVGVELDNGDFAIIKNTYDENLGGNGIEKRESHYFMNGDVIPKKSIVLGE